MQKNLCAAALCLMLAACGGGGGDSPSAAPTPVVAQAPKCTPLAVVKIELTGDSTEYGIDGETFPYTQSPNNPTAVLQRLMDARFGAGAVLVEDHAVPGTRADQWVSFPGDITVANYGINDMFVATIDEYKANLRKLDLKFYETPNPISYPGWNRPEYAQAMRDVAQEKGVPVIDTDAYVRGLPNWDSYLGDQIHPNGTLYGMIVQNVMFPKMEPMVAKLKCQ